MMDVEIVVCYNDKLNNYPKFLAYAAICYAYIHVVFYIIVCVIVLWVKKNHVLYILSNPEN